MKKDLSSTMLKALQIATNNGGRLERLPGGFWTYPGCERAPHNGVPHWYVGTSTVEALIARERMTYVEWKEGKSRFPIVAQVIGP